MTQQDLGYHQELEQNQKAQNLEIFQITRVVSEHKSHYTVKTTNKELDAETIGNLRFFGSKQTRFTLGGRLGCHFGIR